MMPFSKITLIAFKALRHISQGTEKKEKDEEEKKKKKLQMLHSS